MTEMAHFLKFVGAIVLIYVLGMYFPVVAGIVTLGCIWIATK